MKIFTPPTTLRNCVALAGLALAAGNVLPSFAQNARLPYQEETWIRPTTDGDLNKKLSIRTLYFYNSQNKLARAVKYGVHYGSQNLDLSQYSCYDYDAKGNLVTSYVRNTKYDSEKSLTLKDPQDSVTYSYNDLGQLSEMKDKRTKSVYTYDADGNLYQESVFLVATGVCMKTLTYTGYVAPECPSLVSTDSELYEYYRCKEAYTYNDAFKPLTYEKYTETTSTDSESGEGTTVKTVSERKEYTYSAEDGMLLGVLRYEKPLPSTGLTELQKADSVGYSKTDDGSCIEEVTYIYNKEKQQWIESALGSTNRSYYRDYNGGLARHLTVTESKGGLNDYAITFDLPTMGNYRYNIYKDGQLLKEAKMSDEGAVNPSTMKYTYIDKDVASGHHDYFVQTVAMDFMGNKTPMNISNTVSVYKTVAVPPVENLHVVSYERDREVGYYVKVAWDMPAEAEKYGWQRNNVYVGKTIQVPSNTNTDGQETEWNVEMNTKTSTETVRVEAVYATARAEVSIDLYMKDIIDGISQTVASDLDATYTNHELHLSKPVNVKVYTIGGQLVKTENATTNVSLENENTGSYVLLVDNEGKVTVLKVQR